MTLPTVWHTGAAQEIRSVLDRERTLAVDNQLAPYADILPIVLPQLSAHKVAAALAELEPAEACQALFGNFRALPSSFVVEVLTAMAPADLAALAGEMALGFDLPRLAARLLVAAGSDIAPALLATQPSVGARLAGLMDPGDLATILRAASRPSLSDWLAAALDAASPAEAATLLDVLRTWPGSLPDDVLCGIPEAMAGRWWAELSRPIEPAAGFASPTASQGVPEAARLLARLPSARQRDLLSRLSAHRAAEVLTELASADARSSGFLLGTQSELVLARGAGGVPRRLLHGSRGAAILARLDPDDPRSLALLACSSRAVLKPFLARIDTRVSRRLAAAADVAPPGFATCEYPSTASRGCRRSRWMAQGMRWIYVRETVVRDGRDQALRVDLLEVDPDRTDLVACRAAGPLPPIQETADRLGRDGRAGPLPNESAFAGIGLVRLADAVAGSVATAGINGGFYTDYGLCLDAHDLGIDLSEETNLRLGDVVGWFVRDGREVAPPLFNRAVLAITADGRPHIRRVAMTEVVLPNGVRLGWEAVNGTGPGGTILYDRVWGATTPVCDDRVELCVSRRTITAIGTSGASKIPLLGFVLAIPAACAHEDLAGVRLGQSVRIGNDFPAELGPVHQAMASGPMLVRDGQVSVDFEAEGFGLKDSTVLPLSLSRVVDTFRAARSFVMLRHGGIVFGAVSGTMLGSGPPRVSAGMTFGELAQLCVDLAADDAIGLDGGGSSSLVASVAGLPQVLSVPTGGSDVAEGSERFIKTYWLAQDRPPPARDHRFPGP